jgi:hypothetical protein
MKNGTNPKPKRDESATHGCCGGVHEVEPKQVQKETGCGCGDKRSQQAVESSCCK